jgi:hypothetical protein
MSVVKKFKRKTLSSENLLTHMYYKMFPSGKFQVKFNVTASPVYYTQPSTPQQLLDEINFKGDYYKITKIEIVMFNQAPKITNLKISNEKGKVKLYKNFYITGSYQIMRPMNHKTKSNHSPKLSIMTSNVSFYSCIVYYTAYYEVLNKEKFLEVEQKELKTNKSWPVISQLSNYEKLKLKLTQRNNKQNVVKDASYNIKYIEIPQVYAKAPIPQNIGSKAATPIKDLVNDIKNEAKRKVKDYSGIVDKGAVLPQNETKTSIGKETVGPSEEVSSKWYSKNKKKRQKKKQKDKEKLKNEKEFDVIYSKLEVVAKTTVPQMESLFTGHISKKMFLTQAIKILDELGYNDNQIDEKLFAFIQEWNLRNPQMKFPKNL